MLKRILAIAVIFVGTAAAWCILGSTIFLRTESTTSSLSGRVASTWGDTQEQTQPDIHYLIEHTETVKRHDALLFSRFTKPVSPTIERARAASCTRHKRS